MKLKYAVFIFLAGLAVQSCTLPSSVGVKAKPSVSLPIKPGSANLDELFSDAVQGGFSEGGDVYDCPNEETLTFLIYFAHEGEGALNGVAPGPQPSPSLVSRSVLSAAPGGRASIRKSETASMDDYLKGFEFSDVKAYFYVSSDEATTLNKFGPKPDIKVNYTDKDGNENQTIVLLGNKKITIQPGADGIDKSAFIDAEDSSYTSATFPPSSLTGKGEDISDKITELLNDHPQSMEFECTITEVEDQTPDGLSMTNFNNAKDASLKVELLIWIPLKFKAGADGAELKFPDMFDADEDLFGRNADGQEEDSMLDMMKSLSLEIKLNKDAFKGGALVITGGYPQVTLGPYSVDESLKMDITSDKIGQLKKTRVFAPDVGIKFKQDDTFDVLKGLGATSINFTADIDYKFEL
jgi:hypothetical protein